MPYTARSIIPGGRMPEEERKRHGLSKAAHWAYDQRTERKPMSRTPSRPALRTEKLPEVGSVPRGMLGYGEGHGARLRAERRNWEREKAYALAGTHMAEIEREQTGQTRRAEMAGQMGVGKGVRAGAGAPKSTRMKSFDYASKAMSEMYPEGINPVTNKPFSSEAWEKRLVELAESREAYGGVQPAEERPAGLSGRGRVLRESGEMYDIEPGFEGYTKSMATPGMIEAAGFAPRVPANRASQMMAGEKATKKPSKALLRLREKYKDIYPAAIKGFRGFTGGW